MIEKIDKQFPVRARLTTRRRHDHIAPVKWRNQLLALLLLVAFVGIGVIYFQHWVVQKPFGIILFIGQGLSPGRLAATRVYAGGAETHLALDSMEHIALIRNYSKDFATPDQAAAATAIATGTRVNNGAIARNSEGKPLASIVELARDQGRVIGLVTDVNLTEPTCAAFYAHPAEPNDTDAIAREFVEGGKIEIALGGGLAQFLPSGKGGARQDNRDLLLELRRNGFDVAQTRAELEAIPTWKHSKLFGVFS
jgi:alkaline phosphatase